MVLPNSGTLVSSTKKLLNSSSIDKGQQSFVQLSMKWYENEFGAKSCNLSEYKQFGNVFKDAGSGKSLANLMKTAKLMDRSFERQRDD